MISMKQLTEAAAAPVAGANSSATPWRNVALRPMAYDRENKITTGIDISTGETLSIRLDAKHESEARDNVDVWSAERYKVRNNITSIANAKAVVPGPGGGVIIFEGVHPVEGGGPLEARWGNTAAHAADVAEVAIALVRPATTFGSKTQMDDKFPIELIRPMAATPIRSQAQLKTVLLDIINQPFVNALVRVLDGEDEVSTALLYKRKEQSAEEAVERFMTMDRIARVITDEVCEGAIVEVLPVERIYPGLDYKKVLGDRNKTDSKIYHRDWSLGENKGYGFASSIVALRRYQAPDGTLGGLQLTKLRPESTRPLLYKGFEDFPTPNITPKSAPVVGGSAQADAVSSAPSEQTTSGSEPVKDAVIEPKKADALAEKLASATRSFSTQT